MRPCACYRAANNAKHAFTTDRAAYALLYVITFRCSSSLAHLSLPFARYYDRQSTSHALYLRRFAFARTHPDKLVYLHPDCQPTRTAMRPPSSFRTLCARHIRNFAAKAHTRPLLPPNCRSTPRLDSFGSLYSRKRCRGAHFFAFSFHVEHTSCHSPKPQHLSRFCLFMHIYTLRHCMFFAYPFAFSAPAILSPLSLRG